MEFPELVNYVKTHQMQNTYQPVFILALLANRKTKTEIEKALFKFEPFSKSGFVTVSGVLRKNGIIRRDEKTGTYELTIKLSYEQDKEITKAVLDRIDAIQKKAKAKNGGS